MENSENKEAMMKQAEAIMNQIAEQDSRSEQDKEFLIAISEWMIAQRCANNSW